MNAMVDANVTIDVPEGATADDQIAAVKGNDAALKILSDAGYTPEAFYPVIVNATIAISMVGAEAQRKEIEAARESLNTQKDTLTQEQYDQALAQITAQLEMFDSVPAENITLAARHQSAFDALNNVAR